MEIKPITYPQQVYTSQGSLNTESVVKRVIAPATYPKFESSKVEPVTKTLGTFLDILA